MSSQHQVICECAAYFSVPLAHIIEGNKSILHCSVLPPVKYADVCVGRNLFTLYTKSKCLKRYFIFFWMDLLSC